jgi:hypothetical protein
MAQFLIGFRSYVHLCLKRFVIIASPLIALHSISLAQSCDQIPPESDFNFEVLVDNLEGNGYAVAVSKSQKLYWVEREGNFKMMDLSNKQVKLIRKMDVNSSPDNFDGANEGGLEGIALDLSLIHI